MQWRNAGALRLFGIGRDQIDAGDQKEAEAVCWGIESQKGTRDIEEHQGHVWRQFQREHWEDHWKRIKKEQGSAYQNIVENQWRNFWDPNRCERSWKVSEERNIFIKQRGRKLNLPEDRHTFFNKDQHIQAANSSIEKKRCQASSQELISNVVSNKECLNN